MVYIDAVGVVLNNNFEPFLAERRNYLFDKCGPAVLAATADSKSRCGSPAILMVVQLWSNHLFTNHSDSQGQTYLIGKAFFR